MCVGVDESSTFNSKLYGCEGSMPCVMGVDLRRSEDSPRSGHRTHTYTHDYTHTSSMYSTAQTGTKRMSVEDIRKCIRFIWAYPVFSIRTHSFLHIEEL